MDLLAYLAVSAISESRLLRHSYPLYYTSPFKYSVGGQGQTLDVPGRTLK